MKQVAGSGSQVGKTPMPTRYPLPATRFIVTGCIGALIAHAFWLTSVPFETLKTLFHELGHTIVAWLLGYPAIPAFDFLFGGGFTNYGEFHLPIALAVAAGFVYAGWRLQEHPPLLATIGTVSLVWLIVVTKEWRRETVIASAGVVFELLLAATFLFMVVANVGWRMPDIERPLGALVAFFVQFDSWVFALRLIRDQDFLEWYEAGKGGALMNDLQLIALNLKIYLGIDATTQTVAKLLLFFSLFPLPIAYWLAIRWSSERTRATPVSISRAETAPTLRRNQPSSRFEPKA